MERHAVRPSPATSPAPALAPHRSTVERLRAAGCVAAEEEAAELVAVSGDDRRLLEALVQRRSNGEPLAWITGEVRFCGE
ncbi:MAG TPA: hypothetical protein VMU09_13950, partial [Acidimicrobiales bacterium]|nr:hypothetical protein [Acidimicrobiales bacterium]